MANFKKITIDGKEYTIKANALLPRRYRLEFGRDLISDLNSLQKQSKSGNIDWRTAENLTWLMIKTAGEQEIGTVEEWLASIDDAFAIPMVFGEVLGLWADNQTTTSVPAKK